MNTLTRARALLPFRKSRALDMVHDDVTSFGVHNVNLLTILSDIEDEFRRAVAAFPPFNSAHEGYAVIAEELDELWGSVRANKGGTRVTDNAGDMRQEAIQVATMALRFVHDICDRP